MEGKKKPRLAVVGDYVGESTGFATVLRNILKGLHKSSNYELFHLGAGLSPVTLLEHLENTKQSSQYIKIVKQMQHSKDSWDLDYSSLPFPYRILPMKGSRFGENCLKDFLLKYEIDAAIILFDPWMSAWSVLYDVMPCPIIYYQPIDAVSYPGGEEGRLPAIRAFLSQSEHTIVSWERFMALQDITVLYGEWGREVYERAIDANTDAALLRKYANTYVIRHGIDPDIYAPMSKQMARGVLNIPQDAFIMLSVMANQPRKDWWRTLLVAKKLKERGVPVRLMPWTNVLPHAGSLDIDWAAKTMGLTDCIYPPYMSTNTVTENMMSAVYNSADVHTAFAMGEGCGLPHIEATACGVPSFAVNETGTRDYFGHDNQKLPAAEWVMWQGNALMRPVVDIDVAIEKIAAVYYEPEETREWAEEARKVVSTWTWESTIPQWEECVEFAITNREKLMKKREDLGAEIAALRAAAAAQGMADAAVPK